MISSCLLLEWSIGTGVKQVKPVTDSFSASCNAPCISMNCAAILTTKGNRQGRDEVISIVPLIMAAKESPAERANGGQGLAGKS